MSLTTPIPPVKCPDFSRIYLKSVEVEARIKDASIGIHAVWRKILSRLRGGGARDHL
jgi:hypothetical protein